MGYDPTHHCGKQPAGSNPAYSLLGLVGLALLDLVIGLTALILRDFAKITMGERQSQGQANCWVQV